MRDRFLDGEDEDLAVADFAGLGRLLDGFNGALDEVFTQDDFDLYLGQEVDGVLASAIDFGVALSDGRSL